MNFQQKLDAAVEKNNSLLCVGLDPTSDKFPFFDFNKTIIDTTNDLVCAYKPNSAFYEAKGAEGIGELKKTCDYIQSTYPEIPIILDAKRGDIGNTNNAYTAYAFEYLNADAVTVIPYLGVSALAPYFKEGKGVIIGCHSSNPEGAEIQDVMVKDKPLYLFVAELIMQQFGDNPNCMIFMGATFPQQLKDVRNIVKDMTFLVPGVGAQSGTLEATVTSGLNSQKKGMIINASRSVIYSANPREEAQKMRDEINRYRS